MSIQPTRRGRPVVVPYSAPMRRKSSASSPCTSVGYGPAPTRVVYAFACPQQRDPAQALLAIMSRGPAQGRAALPAAGRTTPMMAPYLLGARPRPHATPPTEGLDDVTKG